MTRSLFRRETSRISHTTRIKDHETIIGRGSEVMSYRYNQDKVQPPAHQLDSLHGSHDEISRSLDIERIDLSR